jgi:hypothetical protein
LRSTDDRLNDERDCDPGGDQPERARERVGAAAALSAWLEIGHRGITHDVAAPLRADAAAGAPRNAATLPGVDERERRMVENETLFREVNERINDVAGRHDDRVGYEYFCECANADCSFRVTLTPHEYEGVRSDPAQFFVLPQHHMPEIENVIEQHEQYWVVRKGGEDGAYAAALDPRARRR